MIAKMVCRRYSLHMPEIAVLTGDIIGSTSLSKEALDQIVARLKAATIEMSDWKTENNAIKTAFARRGGDGWQAILTAPELALRAALFLRASLMAMGPYQTRIAIGTGSGDVSHQTMADPNHGYGHAFFSSGRLLENLPRNATLQHATAGGTAAASSLADHISSTWTEAQAHAMALAIAPENHTQQVIADQLGISRQAVAKSLKSAGYPAIKLALHQIESGEAAQDD
ncbi:SatD family protein [Aliiroseovarius sp. S1123]|jgi:hypothetical protein|uniref:SatD family protein n=1 Tax=unclassified Aliiroseovarius TaxID=2623558 RepID=UPI001FF6280F|nr:SatD family protein [Aliiroseovarius sp. S1123]MCK0170658.1 SatD family protein [Aliiroseovarius sp. S1123]